MNIHVQAPLDYINKRQPISTDATEYVLSDGKPDRTGDSIDPKGWVLSAFDPIALFNHNRDLIIGKWSGVRVIGDELRGVLELALPGTSPAVDMVRSLIAQGLLDTVSVGMRPLDAVPVNPKDPFGPRRYTKSELIEASLVSVPANPRARRIIKEFFPDEAAISVSARSSPSPSGVSARSTIQEKQTTMTTQTQQPLGKRIELAEGHLVGLKDQLVDLDKQIAEASDGPTDEQALSVDVLNGEIEKTTRSIATLKTIETGLATKAAREKEVRAPALVRGLTKTIAPRDYIIRGMACMVAARIMAGQGKQASPIDVLKQSYGDDEMTGLVLRAAMQPATTTVAGWASELVNQTLADFLGQLPIKSIFPKLASLGPGFTFGQNGIIKVPSRSATPKVNGSFVGEGQPIPVRRLGTAAITLTPKKMAVISEFSAELAITSMPSIESVIRQAINEDTAEAIDTVLIDATAADAIRPAGLRNGVSGLTPSTAATPFDKMVADIKALNTAITGARGGRSLVLLINPAQEQSLQWTVVNGVFLFDAVRNGDLRGLAVISSPTVPAGTLIMVDAADFASVTGDTPEFNVSDVATIHEEDTTPLPIATVGTPNVASAPVRSLWQTYSIGIRMILPMNWAMRRPGMISWMSSVTW